MKKIIAALGGSLAINLLTLYINWRAFLDTRYLKWSYRSFGGEITIENAFALRAVHTYGMILGATDSHSLHFSLLNALLFLAAWGLVIYVGIVLAGRLIRAWRSKRAARED